MATIKVREWVLKELSEICPFYLQYECKSVGKHLLTHKVKNRPAQYILACDKHVQGYLAHGWHRQSEAAVFLKRDNLV